MVGINVLWKTLLALLVHLGGVISDGMGIVNDSKVAKSKWINRTTPAHAIPLGRGPT